MRRALALLALVAACRSTVPLAGTPDASPAPSPPVRDATADAAGRLHDLCETANKAYPSTPPPEPSSDAIDPAVAARYAKLVRPLLPAPLRREDPEVFVVHPVRGGHLVELTAAEPEGSMYSRSSHLAFVATAGGGRLLPNDILQKRADFDGDGKEEPLTMRCMPKTLFARECTFTVWFPAREVTFTRTLMRGSDAQVREHERRADLWILPADSVDSDFFTAEDLLVASFTPAGTTTSDGAAIFARDVGTAKLRYALEACETADKLRELDAPRWERRLRALGATDAEAPSLARHLVEKRSSSLKRDPNDPITIRGMLAQHFPDPKEDAAVWAALPPAASTHCGALPAAAKEAWTREHEALIRRRVDARFDDLVAPVEASFGCTTKEGTLALITWAEEAYFEALWSTELYFLRPTGSSELLATTRSQWIAEYHHVFDIELGPSADFDGDGEDDTLIIATEHEVGMGGREKLGAIWKNGAVRQMPERSIDRLLVRALDPTRPAIVLTPGPNAPKSKLWPPKVFTFEKDTFRAAKTPAAWTTATKSARDAFLATRTE